MTARNARPRLYARSRIKMPTKYPSPHVLVDWFRFVQCAFKNVTLQQVYNPSWNGVALSKAALQGWYGVNIPTRRTAIFARAREKSLPTTGILASKTAKRICSAFDRAKPAWTTPFLRFPCNGNEVSLVCVRAFGFSHDRSTFKYQLPVLGSCSIISSTRCVIKFTVGLQRGTGS